MARMLKYFKLVTGVSALVCWFSSFVAWHCYANHPAWTYEPSTGRIHELNTHGSVVYLTSGEYHLLYGLMVGGVVFAVLTAIIHFSWSGN
jgi:hypothetical protein